MKIVQLTPGTGTFHCGSCLRDHALVSAINAMGHDISMVPLYLPPVLDSPDGTEDHPVFFGGINAYLQQKSSVFRNTPRWVDKMFDRPSLLRWSSKKVGMTDPADLGAMTLSMLKGESGKQVKELERLVQFLSQGDKPDIVCLSNVLLAGMARRIGEQLNVPVICTMQGEDSFLDSLPEPYAQQCWDELKKRSADVEVFVAVSHYYGQTLRERLELSEDHVRVVYNGLRLDQFKASPRPMDPPVIGYLARMCPQKGLHTLIGAYIQLRQRDKVGVVKLRVAGAKIPADESYVKELKAQLKASGFHDDVEFMPNVSRQEKLDFLQSLTLLSVPALYGESFGLYLIEALACEVPVLQPKHAAFPEIIELTKGGELFEASQEFGYVQALETMLSDSKRLKELGEQGRVAVEQHFSDLSMATAALEVYNLALEKRNERTRTAAP